jgi:hypothetical protein
MDSTGGEQVVGLGVSKVQILAEKESFKQYSSGSSYVYPVLFCKIWLSEHVIHWHTSFPKLMNWYAVFTFYGWGG